jgi:SAM-dependent methyltransferase
MSFMPSAIERATSDVYGGLWNRYDDHLFRDSVEIFRARWLANGEPADFFQGKHCLDAGCGGGRYSIAMALMGAASVIGIDISENGLQDGRKRQQQLGINNIEFQAGSVLHLPFPSESFDFVCSSGVLHHTPGIEQGLREMARVLRPGGSMYLLVYGSGGIFWPSNLLLRPLAGLAGWAEMYRGVSAAGVADNRRRSILDDLFVPLLETYPRERIEFLLRHTGFHTWHYWTQANLDHESDANAMIEELQMRLRLWEVTAATSAASAAAIVEQRGAALLGAVVDAARSMVELHRAGCISQSQLRDTIIGHGHHRLVAVRR